VSSRESCGRRIVVSAVVFACAACVAVTGCASGSSGSGRKASPSVPSVSPERLVNGRPRDGSGGSDPRCPGDCDVAAASSSQVAEYPPAQPAGPQGTWMSGSQAASAARASAVDADGFPLTDNERSNVPVALKEMTASGAADLLTSGDPLDTLLPPDRQVWVVQVGGYQPVYSLSGRDVRYGYVVVLDLPTGTPIARVVGLTPFDP
jgi:hypothetical protein